jgi:hypothetical protein
MTPQDLFQKIVDLAKSTSYQTGPSQVCIAAATYLALVALAQQNQSNTFKIHRRRIGDLLGFSRAGVYHHLNHLQVFGAIRWVHLKNHSVQITILMAQTE